MVFISGIKIKIKGKYILKFTGIYIIVQKKEFMASKFYLKKENLIAKSIGIKYSK